MIIKCGLLLVFQITLVLGLEESVIDKSKCFQPSPKAAENFNQQWFNSVKTWYSIYGSKDRYFKIEENKSGDKMMNNKYCHKMIMYDKKTSIAGLGDFEMKIPSKGNFMFTPIAKSGTSRGAHLVITLTDNKNFIFVAQCFDKDKETWQAASPYLNVDKETEDKIFAHAKSMGFNEVDFEKKDNSVCDSVAPASQSEEEYSEDNISSDLNQLSDEQGDTDSYESSDTQAY